MKIKGKRHSKSGNVENRIAVLAILFVIIAVLCLIVAVWLTDWDIQMKYNVTLSCISLLGTIWLIGYFST